MCCIIVGDIGDSGAPLLLLDAPGGEIVAGLPELDHVVGIVSFGPKKCGMLGKPGVYTRLSSFLDWITDMISSKGQPKSKVCRDLQMEIVWFALMQ